MLNEVHIEGYVTKKQWTYSNDQFFRLAAYRDPDRPRKENEEENRDRPDYVTVKLPASLMAGLPVRFESGQRVQVHGWLESRQYTQSLTEFLESAHNTGDGKLALEIETQQADGIVTHRSSTWIVADRIVLTPKDKD